jgi:uncharacterized membrane protein YeiB
VAAPAGLTGRTALRSRWERLNDAPRVTGIDLARGLAIVGMLTAHLVTVPDLVWNDPSTYLAVVDGRSSILFATLAGVSMGLVTGGDRPPAIPAMMTAWWRLAVRAGVLWVLGILLIATGVPVFVILPAYAVLFLLAIPFTALSARTLFVVAGVIALVMPWVQVWLDALPVWSTPVGEEVSLALGWHYPFPVWIAFVLAGLGLARAGIRDIRVQVAAVAAGVGLAALGYGLHIVSGTAPSPAQPPLESSLDQPSLASAWTALPHSSGVLEAVGSGGFALAVVGACLLVCRTALVWLALPLRATGAMPLTAYTAQILVWAVWAAVALGDTRALLEFRALSPFLPITLGVIVGCTAWALLVGRGPLEWATDRIARLVVRDRAHHGAPDRLGR